jgi:hypothetical protein
MESMKFLKIKLGELKVKIYYKSWRVERFVKSTRYARCHKCCSNPYPKGEINFFCSKLTFFQIQSLCMQLQTIVDHRKQFLDVFMGMLGSMNDAKGYKPIFNLSQGYMGKSKITKL